MINYRRPSTLAASAPARINRLQMPSYGMAGSEPPPPMFGVNQPLPLPGMQSKELLGPAAQQVAPTADDYMKRYNDVIGNRPDKLAYRDAIESGAPQINRGKWAKLGAVIAASAEGLHSGSATSGYNLGMSAYQEPQRKSDERYKERVTGLGQLANMEESDVTARIKALEAERENEWKQKDFGLREEEGKRATKLNDVQIAHINQQMDDADTDKWTDEVTGISYERNKQGVVRTVGQTQMSAAQKIAHAGSLKKAEADAETPGKIALANTQGSWGVKQAEASANAANQRNQDNIKARAELQAKRLEATAKGMKPGDKYAQALINIAAASRSDETLSEPGLLGKDELGMPVVAPDSWSDSDETRLAKQKLRTILATSLGEASTNMNGGSAAGSNQSAGTGVSTTATGNRTVKVIAPDGSFTMETPEDAQTMVTNSGGQVKIEGAASEQAAPVQTPPVQQAPPAPSKSFREMIGFRNPPAVENPMVVKPAGMAAQPGFGTKSFRQIIPQGTPIPAGRGPITSIPEQPVTQRPVTPPNFGMDPNAVIPPHTSPPPNGPITRPQAPVQAPPPNPIQLNKSNAVFNDKLLSVMQKVKAETGLTIKPSSQGRGNSPDAVGDVKVYDRSGKVITDPSIMDQVTAIAAGEGLMWDGKSLRLGR